MENVTFVQIQNPFSEDTTEHAIIDRGNGEFTSMTKAAYDEMIEKAANVNLS